MSELMSLLSIPVIRNALIGMVFAGATLSLLGVVVVSLHLQVMRFMLMHVGLLGAAAAIAIGASASAGAFALVPVASILLGLFGKGRTTSASAAGGLFMTGSLAGAFILLSRAGVPAMDVFAVFAGNILMLRSADLVAVIVLGAIIVAAFFLFYREIQLVLYDSERAQALGVPVRAVILGLFLLLGAGIAAALRLVGALLVDAIILLPAVGALRFARGLGSALLLSSAFGVAGTFGGFLLAVYFDLPIGASAAAVASALLGVTALISPRTG